METSFLWFVVFSGSFGVRSIVLCKCSGKYIDIYFILKITYPLGFPTFAMGSPLRGRGLFVLDRNEGLVSPFGSGTLVISWLALTPLSAASLRALSLRVCCQVVLAVSVSLGCP